MDHGKPRAGMLKFKIDTKHGKECDSCMGLSGKAVEMATKRSGNYRRTERDHWAEATFQGMAV